MDRVSTKKIVLNGLMIALVFLATRLTAIPVGNGYFNIGDVMIMISAIFLGRNSGLLAGSLGSALSDALSPYAYYAPITLVVKGIEGYIIGSIGFAGNNTKKRNAVRLAALVAGVVVMIGGYFIADMYALGLVGQSYGYAAASMNLPTNLVQGILSLIVGYILSTVLEKSGAQRLLQ